MTTKEKRLSKYKLAARLRRTNEGWECAVMKNIPESKVKKTFLSEEVFAHFGRGVANIIPGNVKGPVNKKPVLTDYQYFLYLRAFNGIRIYKKEKIEKMGVWEQNLIVRLNQKCHEVVADLLERAVITISNRILKRFGVASGRFFQPREEGTEVWDTPEEFVPLPFRKLYVTKDIIINELIKKEILPSDFWKLTKDKRNWEQLINEPIDL